MLKIRFFLIILLLNVGFVKANFINNNTDSLKRNFKLNSMQVMLSYGGANCYKSKKFSFIFSKTDKYLIYPAISASIRHDKLFRSYYLSLNNDILLVKPLYFYFGGGIIFSDYQDYRVKTDLAGDIGIKIGKSVYFNFGINFRLYNNAPNVYNYPFNKDDYYSHYIPLSIKKTYIILGLGYRISPSKNFNKNVTDNAKNILSFKGIHHDYSGIVRHYPFSASLGLSYQRLLYNKNRYALYPEVGFEFLDLSIYNIFWDISGFVSELKNIKFNYNFNQFYFNLGLNNKFKITNIFWTYLTPGYEYYILSEYPKRQALTFRYGLELHVHRSFNIRLGYCLSYFKTIVYQDNNLTNSIYRNFSVDYKF